MNEKALEILEKYFGYKSFRKEQEKIISTILKQDDVLLVMPTGGGKSICYQIPALMFQGMTIVISPLISLMKDQVDTLKEMGIECAYINSTLSNIEEKQIYKNIENNLIKILYVAPERLESMEFLNTISRSDISQVAIDEAHCISQWGHDFRSSYKKIYKFISLLKKRPVVTAFTATASYEVREDIINLLRLNNPKIFITGFDRENLYINIIKGENKDSFLYKYLENNKDVSGIIYATTRKDVEKIYKNLTQRGFNATYYHGGLYDESRRENQEAFIYDRVNIMVATNAFGMGIDKSNIRYVVHYNMPRNIESYYQEIGRAGRDSEKSECILLYSPHDVQIQRYLIENSIENVQRQSMQYKKLQQINDFVFSNDCYRKYLLSYFGEELKHNCNNCSNCLSEGEIIEKTIDAQKVLSCIYRMKTKFGATMLIDVLRGSKNKKVIELKFNELSTYGLMKDYSVEQLKTFINTLISHGFISVLEGTYPVLGLNDMSRKILIGEQKVLFKEVKLSKKISEDNELFELLRTLRYNLANENNVPPYVIFGDATLKEMAIKYPINKNSMLQISGVGEIKYEKYGKYFENIIEKYVVENNIQFENIYDENTLNQEVNIKNNDILEIKTDIELYENLKKIRNNFAKEANTLPQTILSINTLKEISGRYPKTLKELNDISGIGPKKIAAYGERIIDEVNDYILKNNLTTIWQEKKRKKVVIDNENRKINEIALDMLKNKIYINEVSKELELSISTILGYVTDYIKEFGEYDLDINLEEFYDNNDEDIILKAIDKVGHEKISLIKKELPEYIKYEAIRSIILKTVFKVQSKK